MAALGRIELLKVRLQLVNQAYGVGRIRSFARNGGGHSSYNLPYRARAATNAATFANSRT